MEQSIPDFMHKYFDGSDEEGKELLKAVASRYEYESQLFFQTTFIHKQRFLRDWNRLTGSRDQLSEEEALRPLNEKYDAEAKEVALKHGYTEKRENELNEETETESVDVDDQQLTAREQFKKNLQTISARQAQQSPRI